MSEPNIMPEECECRREMEKCGIEYTEDFYWDEDDQCWYCEHCGRPQ